MKHFHNGYVGNKSRPCPWCGTLLYYDEQCDCVRCEECRRVCAPEEVDERGLCEDCAEKKGEGK